MDNKLETREEWLTKLADLMRDTLFKQQGVTFEDPYRVSVGWTSKRKAIGECWGPKSSAKGYREIFISPSLDDLMTVASTLAHELCHAALPFGVAHRRPFVKLAHSIGLVGKATETTAGGTFLRWYRETAADIMGEYPHAAMTRNFAKVQTTRLIKVACPLCENEGEPYIARMSAKAIERGTPLCPMHNTPMAV